MKLLLDTHCLLWWLEDPSLISAQAHKLISDPANLVFISAAVIWEIAIKQSLGKLVVVGDIDLCIAKSLPFRPETRRGKVDCASIN
jgi:PIN domain nuclease of toxin-antitoxin system